MSDKIKELRRRLINDCIISRKEGNMQIADGIMFVLYLVCFNTYIKKGGGTTGHVNEASLYNDRQITSLNLPNTVALYIDKGKAADIESPGLVRPWQMQTAVGNNIPDILPSRALSIDNKEKARVKEINELAHTINSMNIDNPKRTTLIKEYINLAYNN